jgi:CheY-like chemotaxis protein
MVGKSESRTTRGSVLIADDDALIRMTLGMVATRTGFSAVQLPDGTGIEAAVQTTAFDLCIMDVSMDGPGVEERVAAIRRHSPATKIVILSGSVEPPEAQRLEGARFLSKPIDLAVLTALFDEARATA